VGIKCFGYMPWQGRIHVLVSKHVVWFNVMSEFGNTCEVRIEVVHVCVCDVLYYPTSWREYFEWWVTRRFSSIEDVRELSGWLSGERCF
jgi:hypothetical protein